MEVMELRRELETFRSLSAPESRQWQWYSSMLTDGVGVRVLRAEKVLGEEILRRLRGVCDFQPKRCYRNAWYAGLYLKGVMGMDVKYVEGKMGMEGIPMGIDHAWNRIGDLYVDFTCEFVLGDNPEKSAYLAIGEWTIDYATDVFLKEGVYGGVYEHNFRHSLIVTNQK